MDVVKFFGNSRSEESSTRALKKKIPVHHAKTDHFGNSRLEESSTRALENDIPVHHAETDHGAPPQYAEHAEDSVTLEGLPLKRPSDLKVIAVMGPTGSGKSTLISKLAGQNVMVGHNLSSCKCFHQTRILVSYFSSLFGQALRMLKSFLAKSVIRT